MAGMIDNPKVWALDHRFWMNSELFCEAWGLELFDKNGIRNPIGFELNIDLALTKLIEAEMDQNTITEFGNLFSKQQMTHNQSKIFDGSGTSVND